MKSSRYAHLMSAESGALTHAEMREGWHFCPEWDYLLVCLGGNESCSCEPWTEEQITTTPEADHE